jgi:hypothetical protein
MARFGSRTAVRASSADRPVLHRRRPYRCRRELALGAKGRPSAGINHCHEEAVRAGQASAIHTELRSDAQATTVTDLAP